MKTSLLVFTLFVGTRLLHALPVSGPVNEFSPRGESTDTQATAKEKSDKPSKPATPPPPATPSTPEPRREPPARPAHLFM